MQRIKSPVQILQNDFCTGLSYAMSCGCIPDPVYLIGTHNCTTDTALGERSAAVRLNLIQHPLAKHFHVFRKNRKQVRVTQVMLNLFQHLLANISMFNSVG